MPRSAPLVEVFILGPFRLLVAGPAVPDEAWGVGRAVELVALLALAPDHRRPLDQVVERLWPDQPVGPATANLHRAADQVRAATGDERAIVLDGGHVALYPHATVVVDAATFERAAQAALATGRAKPCVMALRGYGEELLPCAADRAWAADARRRHAELRISVLRGAGRWDDVLRLDPLAEDAARELMRHFADRGDGSSALIVYERLRRDLADQLGVEPESATQALHRNIRGVGDAWGRPGS